MKRKRSDPAVGLAQQCGQGTGVLEPVGDEDFRLAGLQVPGGAFAEAWH